MSDSVEMKYNNALSVLRSIQHNNIQDKELSQCFVLLGNGLMHMLDIIGEIYDEVDNLKEKTGRKRSINANDDW